MLERYLVDSVTLEEVSGVFMGFLGRFTGVSGVLRVISEVPDTPEHFIGGVSGGLKWFQKVLGSCREDSRKFLGHSRGSQKHSREFLGIFR